MSALVTGRRNARRARFVRIRRAQASSSPEFVGRQMKILRPARGVAAIRDVEGPSDDHAAQRGRSLRQHRNVADAPGRETSPSRPDCSAPSSPLTPDRVGRLAPRSRLHVRAWGGCAERVQARRYERLDEVQIGSRQFGETVTGDKQIRNEAQADAVFAVDRESSA